jgi:hypothetical protein
VLLSCVHGCWHLSLKAAVRSAFYLYAAFILHARMLKSLLWLLAVVCVQQHVLQHCTNCRGWQYQGCVFTVSRVASVSTQPDCELYML